jgi:3-keto-5-aminohexanoate cleavage enzyme
MKPNLTDPGKVVITVATTGGLHGREANPALPEQPKDIIQNFKDCYNAGATVAHMHVRDERGVTTARTDIYAEVIDGVMAACPGMITQVGNGIGLRYETPGEEGEAFTLEERMNLLNIQPQPDQLTLNLGTFHFEHKNTEFLFPNSKKWNAEFVDGCKKRGIRNELEVYDLSHIQNAIDLMERGFLELPLHFSFVLGIKGAIPPTPANLLAMLDALPDSSSWQVVSIGKYQLPLSTMALALGGNIRVGMEDNVYYSHGVLAVSNTQLVERAVRLVRELGREIASPEEARDLMHLVPQPQRRPN